MVSAGLDRTATVGRHLSAAIGADDTASAGEMHAVSISGSATRREITGKRIALTTGDATILRRHVLRHSGDLVAGMFDVLRDAWGD